MQGHTHLHSRYRPHTTASMARSVRTYVRTNGTMVLVSTMVRTITLCHNFLVGKCALRTMCFRRIQGNTPTTLSQPLPQRRDT
jgi:hypothetical protein